MLSRSLWLSGIHAWNLKMAYPPSGCRGHMTSRLPAVGWKAEHYFTCNQPAVQIPDFILDHLTFHSLYWLRYSITVNRRLIVELWSSCKVHLPQSQAFSSGQLACHACSAECWKEQKFVTRLFDFHATVTRCSLSVRGMIIWATIKSNQCQMASVWHAGKHKL